MYCKLVYKVNGQPTEIEFDSYYKLLLFVAENKVKDEDFVSMQIDEEVINGIDELAAKAIAIAQEGIDIENAQKEHLN